jgi:hypothetical protein
MEVMAKTSGSTAFGAIFAGLADDLHSLRAEGESYEKVAMCRGPVLGAIG